MGVNQDARTIGRRLRQIRQSRRKSLRVVAELAGISAGHLSRIENGQRALDRRSVIVALADALQVSPTELTSLPIPAPDNGVTDASVDAIRRALLAATTGLPGGATVDIDVLRSRVATVLDAQQACRHDAVAAALPRLIRDLHTALASGQTPQQRCGWYRCCTSRAPRRGCVTSAPPLTLPGSQPCCPNRRRTS